MQELRLIGVSHDGGRVVLAAGDGARYSVPLDDRLRAAVRVDRTRLGQLEIQMSNEPRPRDIQAAIRAGGSVQDVAEAFAVDVERVERYARPVLAERSHITETALATTARRGGGASQPALGALVPERLHERGVDPTALEWDSWRRPDGKWTVRLDYVTSGRPRHAEWQFDATGRYLVPDDDEARWLVAEESRDAGVVPFGRRPVEAETEPEAEEHDTLPIVRDEPVAQAVNQSPQSSAGEPAKPARKGRASVPSWDDIVFGSRRSD